MEQAERIIERETKLRSERTTWDSHVQEVLDYVVPRKADVTSSRTPGSKENPEIYDSTAIQAGELLAGALHGMLTNPTTKWFELTTGDEALDSDDDVREWLQGETDGIHDDLNGSNFQTEVHEVYIDLVAPGTACLAIEEDKESFIRFSARPFKEYCVDEDDKGQIDTVYRSFTWKPRQIVQRFGIEKVGEYVQQLYQKGSDDSLEIIHAVEPRDIALATRGMNPKTFDFASYYVLKDKKFILKESGFKEFPYAVPRWSKTSGEKLGRSPSMKMLADIKMVNQMMKATIEGAQFAVRPPTWVEDDGIVGNLKLVPGGLTIGRSGAEPPKPIFLDPRIDFGYQVVEDVRKRIRAGYYVDQIQLNEGPQKTATEVMRINEDQLRFMGPVLGRQHNEFLKPVVERVYAIRLRAGRVKPAPEKLRNIGLKVKYSSLIARAQRVSEGQNFMRAAQAIAPVLQVEPGAAKVIDGKKATKYLLNIHGVPQSIIRTDDEIQQMEQAEAQAKQEALQQQQEAHQADQVAKVGPTLVQAAQQQGAV